MDEQKIPHVQSDPDDGGNVEVHGGAGEEGDELEVLLPEEQSTIQTEDEPLKHDPVHEETPVIENSEEDD